MDYGQKNKKDKDNRTETLDIIELSFYNENYGTAEHLSNAVISDNRATPGIIHHLWSTCGERSIIKIVCKSVVVTDGSDS